MVHFVRLLFDNMHGIGYREEVLKGDSDEDDMAIMKKQMAECASESSGTLLGESCSSDISNRHHTACEDLINFGDREDTPPITYSDRGDTPRQEDTTPWTMATGRATLPETTKLTQELAVKLEQGETFVSGTQWQTEK